MKYIYTFFVIALLLVNTSCEKELFGCLTAEGEVQLQTIDLPTISKIDLAIDGDIIIKEGEAQEIQIEATQNVIDRIVRDSRADSDKWKINIDGCSNVRDVKIFATLLSLESLEITADGSIITDGVFSNIDELDLEIDGDGLMDIQLDAVQNIDTKINGTGIIKVSGESIDQNIDIDGDGVINAFDLYSKNSNVKINGQGTVNVRAENILNVDLNGSGTVCYKGSPTLSVDISGDGEVNNCN